MMPVPPFSKFLATAVGLLLLTSAVAGAGGRGVPAVATPNIRVKGVIDQGSSRSDALKSPQDLFFDATRRELYILDSPAKRLLVYTEDGAFRNTISYLDHWGVPLNAAVDSQGRIFLSTTADTLLKVLDSRGKLLDRLRFPSQTDDRDRAFTTIRIIAHQRGVFVLTSLRGLFLIAPEDLSVAPVPLQINPEKPELNLLLDMFVDHEGNFIFADMRPGQVVVFGKDGAFRFRFGEPGGGPRQISRPTGVVCDDFGRFFVMSTVRATLLVFNPQGGILREAGNSGTAPGQFYFPTRIASNGSDLLYVLEPSLHRVQILHIESPGDHVSLRHTLKKEKGVLKPKLETSHKLPRTGSRSGNALIALK